MPINMSIHRKPIGHGRLAFMDSRLRGNDEVIFFPRKPLHYFTCAQLDQPTLQNSPVVPHPPTTPLPLYPLPPFD